MASVTIHLKITKTDQGARERSPVTLPCVCPENFQPCPACLLRRILDSRRGAPPDSPVFLCKGKPIHRELVVTKLKEWTSSIGMNPQEVSGHSLRRGGATSALMAGRSEAEVMKLGRWKSNTYLRYQAPPDAVMANLSASFVRGE
ncbi:MAG: hypothetical protein GY696_14030 [Gammaproteobacteria bacterium]|nr:hypothetical protein [Gammaproteobacteria bacterium]